MRVARGLELNFTEKGVKEGLLKREKNAKRNTVGLNSCSEFVGYTL